MDQPAAKQPAELPDRPFRRHERRAVALGGVATREDGSTVELTVTDLSNDGCGIETEAELRPGETLQLSVLDHGAIAAKVRWCAGSRAGLVFEADTAAEKPHQPRRSERVPLSAEVALRRTGKLHFRVHVFDVSPDGCQIEFIERPEVDELVWIRFDGLEGMEARVCWVAGSRAGVKYSTPIHPAVFDLLLARLQ